MDETARGEMREIKAINLNVRENGGGRHKRDSEEWRIERGEGERARKISLGERVRRGERERERERERQEREIG